MQFLLHPVRLATIHPLLAHLTIGGTVIFVLAYLIGAQRRSTSWTFAGDAVLFVTSIFTVGTLVFGLVSNTIVPWPGGIEIWRDVHLCLAVGATVPLLLAPHLRFRHRL